MREHDCPAASATVAAKRGQSLPSASMSATTCVTISATASRAEEVLRFAATPSASPRAVEALPRGPNRAGVHDLDLDHRVMPPHAAERSRHDDRTQGRGDPEDALSAGMRLVGANLVPGPLDITQDALRAFEQFVPGFGQPHAAVGAREQGS